jgi:site-specific DNA-methyltransferase (adenine-specific)
MTNQIIQGDCLEVMEEISDKSIDMILCDLLL